jgi:hypothetical protein
MNNRYIIFLLCTAALAYACGPWTHSQSASASTSAYHHKTPREVATTLKVVSEGQHIQLALRVTNNTAKSVELRFPNGMTHDFIVQDPKGHTVWRWSEGRLFTQNIQNKTVHVSDTLTLEDEWNAQNAHGTYIAVATLNTTTHPVERRVAFTLP